MNVWFSSPPPAQARGSALTIGNFDGVHLGHLHILKKLKAEARVRNLAATVLVFEPQPTEFFSRQSGRAAPFRLSPLRDKLRLLEQIGCLDTVWVQRFNADFAAQDAQEFIDRTLIGALDTRFLLIGDDFRFGRERTGGFELLQSQSRFVTESTPSILVADIRASSTAVRQALQQGRLDTARRILGHDYTLGGRVKHGAKLGRTIGCPTANISLPAHRYALSGVFAVSVSGRFGTRHGVASFGTNPTVSDTPQAKLEVHLFDFSGCLYGERLEVSFLHKLRDEVKFADIDEMKRQIWADMSAAKVWCAG